MFKLVGLILVLISIGLIDCEHFDHVKGGSLKGLTRPSFWSSYKAKVVELPSPTIEHIAPIQQRLVIEEKVHHRPIVVEEKIHQVHHAPLIHHHPVQEKLVVEEKTHHHIVEQPKIIEQVRVVEEGVKGHLVTGTKSHHADIILTQQHNHHHHHHEIDHHLAHERRHEELQHQREQRAQLKEIQHYQQIRQHEQIRQQLEQQKQLEHVTVQQKADEHILLGKTNVQHIEQIVQQKQERNEKLTEEEEAVAEPFPLIPKTDFTCDDKPYRPGMYADLQTGCRVYHFCFANTEKAEIVQQIHQDKLDLLHNDVHHVNSLLVTSLPRPEQQQMKSFFCGEGTLFNQKLLICDHAVNVICPESIHYYSANLEFGKAAPEPSNQPIAQLVQQREISKTNHIVQVREPVIVQHPEPVRIVQHHDAIRVVEAPKTIVRVEQPIVQVREQIVQQPVVQVREQIVEPVVQVKEKLIVQHHEPARIVQEQVKIGHISEEAPVVHKKVVTTTNEVVHHTDTHTDIGSFASASDRNSDWRENRSWATSRTVWGETNNNSSNQNATNNNRENDTINVERSNSENRSNEDSERSNENANDQNNRLKQNRPINRRFRGEQIFGTNIPNTNFTCEGKPFENGIYADPETGCRIYHQCSFNGKKSTFLCSKGTLFNQRVLSCDFEEKVKCNQSEAYYTMNVEFN